MEYNESFGQRPKPFFFFRFVHNNLLQLLIKGRERTYFLEVSACPSKSQDRGKLRRPIFRFALAIAVDGDADLIRERGDRNESFRGGEGPGF